MLHSASSAMERSRLHRRWPFCPVAKSRELIRQTASVQHNATQRCPKIVGVRANKTANSQISCHHPLPQRTQSSESLAPGGLKELTPGHIFANLLGPRQNDSKFA